MTNKEIITVIGEIKEGNMVNFQRLYQYFEGLIYHFKRKSDFEDAAEELTLFLIETLYSIDTEKFLFDDSLAICRYIAVCLRNRYILLSKKQQRERAKFTYLNENMGSDFRIGNLDLKEAVSLLSEKQKETVMLRYIYGFSDVEIADMLSVSRQAVNRLNRRGLNILKNYFKV